MLTVVNGSNVKRSNESVRSVTAVTTTSALNHATGNGRQTLRQPLYDCATAKKNRGGVNTSSNSMNRFGCGKTEQLSPGTERDAEHESIGKKREDCECDSAD
jgi:hypothetical protein